MKRIVKNKMIGAALISLILSGCGNGDIDVSYTPSAEATPTPEISATPSATPEIILSDDEVWAGDIILTTKPLDMEGYKYLNDDDPAYCQITFKEMLRLFSEKGTGVIILSYETCPWCNRAVPVLNEAAKDEDMTVFYIDIYEKEMVQDNTEEEWEATLNEFYADADSVLTHQYNQETGEEEPVLYVPLVIGIKKGVITGSHRSLVDSFTLTDEDVQLDDQQHDELLAIYKEILESVKD